MIYDAIINGARSLAFYGGNTRGAGTADGQRARVELDVLEHDAEELIGEISAISPLAPALVNRHDPDVCPRATRPRRHRRGERRRPLGARGARRFDSGFRERGSTASRPPTR